MTMRDDNPMTKQQRAELCATRNATEKQRIALGARLLYHRLRRHASSRLLFAVACIRLQTWY